MIELESKTVSVREQCDFLDVNRGSLYYEKAETTAQELELMKLIDEQYTKTPVYGIRRMTAVLRRLGREVNRKRVQRLMRKMGIEAIYRKPRTSNPAP